MVNLDELALLVEEGELVPQRIRGEGIFAVAAIVKDMVSEEVSQEREPT